MKTTQEYQYLQHEFGPIYDKNSRILILGSFPSAKSREQKFYYGHSQNRFWKVLSGVLDEPLPETVEEKRAFLLANHIALWDVIEECDIQGSSDESIKNVIPTDLSIIFHAADIQAVFANGATAARLYERIWKGKALLDIIRLPSTSPANAAWSLERLIKEWGCIEAALKS